MSKNCNDPKTDGHEDGHVQIQLGTAVAARVPLMEAVQRFVRSSLRFPIKPGNLVDLGRWHHHVSKSWHVVIVQTLDEPRSVRVSMVMEMEMDSHGGLEVTIRHTECKKYPTTSWHRPLSARNEHQSHPLAGQAQACGRLIRRMDRGPDGTC